MLKKSLFNTCRLSTGVSDLNQQSEEGAYYAGVSIGAENHVLMYFPVNRLNSPWCCASVFSEVVFSYRWSAFLTNDPLWFSSVLECLKQAYKGIRSLDESSHLNQSEAVKVARAVKQNYEKLGTPPPRPRNSCRPLPCFITKLTLKQFTHRLKP